MHKHNSYSLIVEVDRFMPELGTPKAYFKCDCGSELSCDDGLAIINAAQPSAAKGTTMKKTVSTTNLFLLIVFAVLIYKAWEFVQWLP